MGRACGAKRPSASVPTRSRGGAFYGDACRSRVGPLVVSRITPSHRGGEEMTAATVTAGPDPRRWQALALVCVAFFMTILDVSIVNVALPSIKESLDVSDTSLQWVLIAYAITFGGFLLLGGRLADLLGRRRIFMIGVAVFAGASSRLRARGLDRRAHRRSRRAGARRGPRLTGDPLDHHHHVRGRGGAEQGARDLGRDGRQRRGGRRPRGRDPDPVPRLGVDLLRQRPRRGRCAGAHAIGRPREPDRGAERLRRRRRGRRSPAASRS